MFVRSGDAQLYATRFGPTDRPAEIASAISGFLGPAIRTA